MSITRPDVLAAAVERARQTGVAVEAGRVLNCAAAPVPLSGRRLPPLRDFPAAGGSIEVSSAPPGSETDRVRHPARWRPLSHCGASGRG
ncbi:hypothetical protein [Pseudonocardia alaniniphila]|uniref:Uncharacterized protein n=1 Tax=Pseudonocardia alaniniphila TaxID=75291 RepID=A0ABS9T7D9_9PSEU|nr:hypothetical protein [Pseudonocardia alaniniphila]MCH6164226.1 hypothetical protein [Pseudonocardia alaniniphila]